MGCAPPPCQGGLQFSGRAKGQAVGGHGLHGGDHLRMRVSQNHRTPGSDIVDVTPPVGGDDRRARRLLDKNGLAAHAAKRTDRRIDAARNVLAGLLVQAQHQSPRLKMTSRPPPFRLLAVAEPPWAFMTSDVMARPIPSPPESRSRDSATL